MSDTGGAFESNLWVDFHSANTILSKMEPSFVKADLAKVAQRLHQRPEDRLKGSLNKINSTACNSVKPGEVLVFGHTHVPFMNKAENVVNSGSWVKDAAIYNTYVELSGGKPRLFVFGGHEITERTDSSQLQPHSSLTSRIRKLMHPADIK
jgi:UDP-2,3-diacylglucosamine pyrophosphatase LpxH